MAGLFSHLISGKATLNTLDDEYKEILNKHKQAYYLGTQGPDLFFYYYTGNFYNSTRSLGYILHKERIGKFLSELLYQTKHIKNDNDREIATAYFLGYISHYVVDAHAHPYVYYHAGFSTRKRFKFSPKNSIYHRRLESNLDKILLDYAYDNAKEHHTRSENLFDLPNNTKTLRYYFKVDKEDLKVISTLLKSAIQKSYDINIDSSRINAALNQMLMTLTVIESNKKIANKLVILDDGVEFEKVDVDRLRQLQAARSDIDYFNFEHREWSAPWDLNIKSTNDFYQILTNAVEESNYIFVNILKYIDGDVKFDDVMNAIQNRSLSHGSDCVEDISFKYQNVIFKK